MKKTGRLGCTQIKSMRVRPHGTGRARGACWQKCEHRTLRACATGFLFVQIQIQGQHIHSRIA